MPTLDSDTLLVRAWPGASHPNPALAAMAALITGPRTEPTQRDWLAASFDRQTRLTVVRQWPEGRPEALREFRLEPDQLCWFRSQLRALVRGEPVERWGWAGGRLLQLKAAEHPSGVGLVLRHRGPASDWTGWRQDLVIAARDAGALLALLQAPRP